MTKPKTSVCNSKLFFFKVGTYTQCGLRLWTVVFITCTQYCVYKLVTFFSFSVQPGVTFNCWPPPWLLRFKQQKCLSCYLTGLVTVLKQGLLEIGMRGVSLFFKLIKLLGVLSIKISPHVLLSLVLWQTATSKMLNDQISRPLTLPESVPDYTVKSHVHDSNCTTGILVHDIHQFAAKSIFWKFEWDAYCTILIILCKLPWFEQHLTYKALGPEQHKCTGVTCWINIHGPMTLTPLPQFLSPFTCSINESCYGFVLLLMCSLLVTYL